MLKLSRIFSLLLITLSTQSFAFDFSNGMEKIPQKVENQEKFWSIEEEPQWVKSYDFKVENLQKKYGVERNILQSAQFDIDSQTEYHHSVVQILNGEGAQKNSYFSLSFDPEYEKIMVHKLNIYRDGEVIDLLKTTQFEVIQQEKDLENYIYNGKLSLIALLENIHIDDILEVSFSYQGFNPIFDGKFFSIKSMKLTEAELYSLRYVMPKARQFQLKVSDENKPTINELNHDFEEWVWEVKDSKSKVIDYDAPSSVYNSNFILISEIKNWEELGGWALKLFAQPEQVSDEIKKLATKIKDGHTTKNAQALAALRYVQDKIRYLGVHSGIGTHLPHDPSEVYKKGYGDCKDKVMLLKALLDQMEIQSYPALVDAFDGGNLDFFLPGPNLFNHAVLVIDMDGEWIWVDPTRTHEGGDLTSLSCAGYKKGFVIRENASELSTIAYQQGLPNIEQFTTYDVSESGLSAKIKIKTVFNGVSANSQRQLIESMGMDQYSKAIEQYCMQRFGDVKMLADVEVNDNRENNRFEQGYEFEAQHFWKVLNGSSRRYFTFFPLNIAGLVAMPINPNRTTPIAIPYPIESSEVRENIVVKGAKLKNIKGATNNFKNGVVSCSVEKKMEDNKTCVCDFTYKFHSDEIAVSELKRHGEMIENIKKELVTVIEEQAPKYMAFAIKAEKSASVGDYADAVVNYKKALEFMTSNQPEYYEVHSELGVCLGQQKKYGAAIKCFEKSLQYYLNTGDYFNIANAYNSVAFTYVMMKNPGKAIDYCQKALEFIDSAGINQAAICDTAACAYALKKDYATAEKFMRKAIDYSYQEAPKHKSRYYSLLANYLNAQGKKAEASDAKRRSALILKEGSV